MRKRTLLMLLAAALFTAVSAIAQQQPWTDTLRTYMIERHDGDVLRGQIISMDARELTVILSDGTRLVLPKHLLRSMAPLEGAPAQDAVSGQTVQTATYVLTSSALPMPKGASSLQFNIAGVALEAFPSERFSVGLLSSWISAPIIATAMYRMPLGNNVWLGAGGLVGWGGSLADRNFFAAPTLTLSMKAGSATFSLTGGYGFTSLAVETYAGPAYSQSMHMDQITTPRVYAAAGLSVKLARNVRLVADAFMISSSASVLIPNARWVPDEEELHSSGNLQFTRNYTTHSNIFIIPAIRWGYKAASYWQFGFAGYKGNLLNLEDNSDWSPLPIPVVQWVIAL